MGRSEARITVDIWSPESDFITLSASAQRMYMFLLSQDDLAHTGLIALRPGRWSQAARDLTLDQVAEDLAELEAARYVVIDRSREELLIRSLIRRDKVYRQPNVLRKAADELRHITSPMLRAALAAELHRVSELPMPEASQAILAEMLQALPQPCDIPTPKPSGNPSDMPTRSLPGDKGKVTVVGKSFPNPHTPFPEPLRTTPSSVTRAPARDRRGTRIPDDFEPTAELVAWARQHAPTTGRADHEAFVDYWRAQPGAKGRKVDWPATWRNWMRREHERRTSNGHRTTAQPQSTTDARVAAGLALAQQLDATQPTKELTQ